MDCRFTYYTLDISQDQREESLKIERYTKASIRLKHNQLPDYIVKHVPEFTFITFHLQFLWNSQSMAGIEYIKHNT